MRSSPALPPTSRAEEKTPPSCRTEIPLSIRNPPLPSDDPAVPAELQLVARGPTDKQLDSLRRDGTHWLAECTSGRRRSILAAGAFETARRAPLPDPSRPGLWDF